MKQLNNNINEESFEIKIIFNDNFEIIMNFYLC